MAQYLPKCFPRDGQNGTELCDLLVAGKSCGEANSVTLPVRSLPILCKYTCISALNKERCNACETAYHQQTLDLHCMLCCLLGHLLFTNTVHSVFPTVIIKCCETVTKQQEAPSAFHWYTDLMNSYWPSSISLAWSLSHTSLNARAALKCVFNCDVSKEVNWDFSYVIPHVPHLSRVLKSTLNLGNQLLKCGCIRNISVVGKRLWIKFGTLEKSCAACFNWI